nr:hypothetical protein BaRGS_031022 [Batillaria attramentaria]
MTYDYGDVDDAEKWDRHQETPEQFVGRFCGRWCNGTSLIQVTYANVHCAACNHDDWATVTWDMVTNCKHNQFMYNVTTDRQYEDRALQLKDVCDVTSQPHDDLKYSLHVCRHIFYGDNVISTCNVTGFWEAEDAEVLALCDQESSNGARVYVFTYGLYRNVFCAMCNVRADFLHSNYEFCMFHNGGAFGPPPDFRGTFDLVNTRRSRRPAFFDFAVVDVSGNCSAGQWLHPTGVCSQLQCADGKTLTGGECKTAVSKVRGLGYHIKLLLQVTQIRRSSRTLLLPSGFTPVPRRHEFQIQENKHTTRVLFPYYVDQDKLPVEFDARTENGAWLSEDGQLMICADSLLTIFPANVTFAPPAGRPSTYVLQVVSVVCGSVSIVCLAATFITYCLFSELRSLPGLHNMGLSVTLASAQLTLLVPWHRTRSSAMCRAVGVITHWAWLSALCWMGVCCTHMVRVFTASSRRTLSRPETLRAFLRGLLLALLVPTVVVAITLGTSAAASGGEHVGYGGGVCFLETGLHVGLAFLLPLALLVVLNLTCFIFTVISIMRVRRLQAQTKRDRSDVLVYAKLATVTGGAWTLGLLAEATDQDWLRVVAELCTASQGLLLFLSYVCNSRVLNLYRNRLGCRVRDPQSTTLTTSSPTFKLTSTDVSDNNARSAGEAGSNP